MRTYRGSCHCNAVTFQIEADINHLSVCNCSVCRKKGILHHAVQDEHFTLVEGKESLSLYQFGTREASHWFCKHCGIHTFGRPRMDPSRYTVNVRCLDDFDDFVKNATEKVFNGKRHPLDQ